MSITLGELKVKKGQLRDITGYLDSMSVDRQELNLVVVSTTVYLDVQKMRKALIIQAITQEMKMKQLL